ncbi:MAG: hypothetical protein Q8738_02570, partial [Candidatus Phytoplasma australasiaticum]|nr:hypothetical protein [Candidatus Phytoplasma australasiaticum]
KRQTTNAPKGEGTRKQAGTLMTSPNHPSNSLHAEKERKEKGQKQVIGYVMIETFEGICIKSEFLQLLLFLLLDFDR